MLTQGPVATHSGVYPAFTHIGSITFPIFTIFLFNLKITLDCENISISRCFQNSKHSNYYPVSILLLSLFQFQGYVLHQWLVQLLAEQRIDLTSVFCMHSADPLKKKYSGLSQRATICGLLGVCQMYLLSFQAACS